MCVCARVCVRASVSSDGSFCDKYQNILTDFYISLYKCIYLQEQKSRSLSRSAHNAGYACA